MKQVKLTQEAGLTAPDLRLKRYIEIDSEIKRLTKELDALKETLKHEGTHSTMHYVCLVEERRRAVPPSLTVLESKYGPGVRELCSEAIYQTVRVTEKG